MFETEGFKNQLTNAVSSEAANSGLAEYRLSIITYLQKLATDNESTLMDREVRKAASEQRGMADALDSARELTREACKYAAADKRTVLNLEDVTRRLECTRQKL
jgi:histone H3/H4